MADYTIYFTTTSSMAVKVQADDLDAAIDAAYDDLPGGICAQCSGWGASGRWTRDEGEWQVDDTAYEVDGEYVEVKS